jgi:hypothetical protein
MLAGLVRKLSVGAGFTILLIGIAIAQTPASPATSAREIAQACRGEISADLRGADRREAMRQCVEKKREAAGLNRRADRRADRESAKAKRQSIRQECRTQFAEQKLTEAERRNAIQGCVAQKDPVQARQQACRQQAEAKKLEQGTREFRQHMRQCRQAG